MFASSKNSGESGPLPEPSLLDKISLISKISRWLKCFHIETRPLDKSAQLNFLYISQPNQMLWVLKVPSQWDGSFEHPKHMF